jgi:hypothetical protein
MKLIMNKHLENSKVTIETSRRLIDEALEKERQLRALIEKTVKLLDDSYAFLRRIGDSTPDVGQHSRADVTHPL